MATDLEIPDHFSTQFDTNWQHLLQQKESRFVQAVMKGSGIKGKEKSYNQIEAGSMTQITGRLQQTRIDELDTKKRWIRTKEYDHVTLFDEFDEDMLGEIPLPESETIQNHAMAFKRRCDQTIIDALEGTAYVGDEGTDTATLGSGQQVAVNYVAPGGTPANSGLTLAKLIRAKSILGTNEVDDDDPLFVAVSQKQLDDLLYAVEEVSSSDYNDVKALVDGKVNFFMGFTFIRTELLTLNASTDVRTCLAWAKSGCRFEERKGGRRVMVDKRPDMNHALQIRTVCSQGATRTEEEKVVHIYCDQSP